MAYTMVAERDNHRFRKERSSALIALANARVWESEGWQVVITDAEGKAFAPAQFAQSLGPAFLPHFAAPLERPEPVELPPLAELEEPADMAPDMAPEEACLEGEAFEEASAEEAFAEEAFAEEACLEADACLEQASLEVPLAGESLDGEPSDIEATTADHEADWDEADEADPADRAAPVEAA